MKKLLSGAALIGAMALGQACCVARGTRVRTPKGERNVEELELGDEVTCIDPATGRLEVGKLMAVRSARRECVSVSLHGRDGLTATSDHPLYCPEANDYHPAGDWALGKRSKLLAVTAAGVEVVSVSAVSTYAGVHQVFDLTVDHALHNFVANGVLVHNKSPARATCVADGGEVGLEGSACTCANGSTGELICDTVTRCGNCGTIDGGNPDAG